MSAETDTAQAPVVEEGANSATAAGTKSDAAERPIATGITRKIHATLNPTRLSIHDDSAAHSGHAGLAGSENPETHFKVEIVSHAFAGVSRLERQRRVYDLLKEEFAAGLHALELKCRTPEEELQVKKPATRAPRESIVPAKLLEWGMDEELWSQIEKKRKFFKMAKRGEEEYARARITRLRELLSDEISPTPDEAETAKPNQQVASEAMQKTALEVEAAEKAPAEREASERAVAERLTQKQVAEGEATETPANGEYMEVDCPKLDVDRTISVALPDGRLFDVVVPEGIALGETFIVGPFPPAQDGTEAKKRGVVPG